MMKEVAFLFCMLVCVGCSESIVEVNVPKVLRVELDSFSRMEVSTWALHQYSIKNSKIPETLFTWCAIDRSDTVLDFSAGSGTDSTRDYYDEEVWSSRSGWSEYVKRFSRSARFSLKSSDSLASLGIRVDDYEEDHQRTYIELYESLLELQLDSLRLAVSTRDSAVFEQVLGDAQRAAFWQQSTNSSAMYSTNRYLGTEPLAKVRVILRR